MLARRRLPQSDAKELDVGRMRELGCAAEPAEARIEAAVEQFTQCPDGLGVEARGWVAPVLLRSSAARMAAFCSSIAPRCSANAPATRSSRLTNAGNPYRAALGK